MKKNQKRISENSNTAEIKVNMQKQNLTNINYFSAKHGLRSFVSFMMMLSPISEFSYCMIMFWWSYTCYVMFLEDRAVYLEVLHTVLPQPLIDVIICPEVHCFPLPFLLGSTTCQATCAVFWSILKHTINWGYYEHPGDILKHHIFSTPGLNAWRAHMHRFLFLCLSVTGRLAKNSYFGSRLT